MKRDNLNQKAYTNINISEEMVDSLIADLKAGKRHSDIRFRHSTAIMSLAIAGAVGFSSIGAGAAYMTYQNRVQNMTDQEQADYAEELAADTYEVKDETRTRSLSNDEYARYLELEDDYYKNLAFPKEILKHVEKVDELAGDELAFVEEINKIHMPKAELTDEQLLQLIDHEAKYLYTIEQNAAKEETIAETVADEYAFDTSDFKTYEVTAAEEQSVTNTSLALIKDIYGVDIDDSWKIDVTGFDWSEVENLDEAWVGYYVNVVESDAPNCTMYQLQIPKDETGEFSVSCSGKKYFANQKEYTSAEAEAYVAEGEQAVVNFVKEKFGLGTPDQIELGKFENLLGEEITSSTILFGLKYGDDYVSVEWNINNKQIYGVSGRNLSTK